MRRDQGQQTLPGNHLIHLAQEHLATGLLAQALGITECQLHAWPALEHP
jgi:hypothetical protein